jgi:hypothetical protein
MKFMELFRNHLDVEKMALWNYLKQKHFATFLMSLFIILAFFVFKGEKTARKPIWRVTKPVQVEFCIFCPEFLPHIWNGGGGIVSAYTFRDNGAARLISYSWALMAVTLVPTECCASPRTRSPAPAPRRSSGRLPLHIRAKSPGDARRTRQIGIGTARAVMPEMCL